MILVCSPQCELTRSAEWAMSANLGYVAVLAVPADPEVSEREVETEWVLLVERAECSTHLSSCLKICAGSLA